ncbi:MAG TPA: hypothetical protein VGH27_10625 [Streptosporangiaceae bacterium]
MRLHETGFQGRAVLAAAALGGCALLLTACGSSGSSSATAATAAVKNTCQQVSAALSDGPDPGSDPVGYAQAQVLPLHQLHASDQSLQKAISALAEAYQQFSSSNGDAAAKQAVSQADRRVNAICPGATS